MPKKPPSSRASDTLTLTLGLVTIPLALYSGTDSSAGITRKEFVEVQEGDKTVDHPVGRGALDKVTGELVPPDQTVVRKVETEYGFVYVSDAEIEELLNLTPKTLEITAFQPLQLFVSGENYVPIKQYFVEPAKTKVGSKKVLQKPVAQAFVMLLKAMREEGVFALVEYTSRGVPKPAALMPNGTLWQLLHTDACREQRSLEEVVGDIDVDAPTVAMGRQLINMYRKNEVIDLSDRRSALIQAFADEKAANGDFAEAADTFVEAEPKAPANDLMALLAASVQSADTATAQTA